MRIVKALAVLNSTNPDLIDLILLRRVDIIYRLALITDEIAQPATRAI